MDIKEKLTDQQKQEIHNLIIETQVLENLLKERRERLHEKGNQIMSLIGLSPKMYNLKLNPGQNIWEAELKPDVLVVPNRETRRALQHS